jgi:nitroreductase
VEFGRVVKQRRMCREYTDQYVSDEQVERILDLAMRYPSAGHTQPQEFIVIRDQGVKDGLYRAALEQEYVSEAPVVIAVVSDTARSAEVYGRRGIEFYSIIDGAFASMLILLAAVDEGLGAAFVGAFDDGEVSRVLSLPRHVRPIGLISIGHCAERPRKFRRRPRKEILHRDRYGTRAS